MTISKNSISPVWCSWIIFSFCRYKYHFPFLRTNGIVNVDDNCVGPLYKHVFPPYLAPWLSFVGLPYRVMLLFIMNLKMSVLKKTNKLLKHRWFGMVRWTSHVDFSLLSNFYQFLIKHSCKVIGSGSLQVHLVKMMKIGIQTFLLVFHRIYTSNFSAVKASNSIFLFRWCDLLFQ